MKYFVLILLFFFTSIDLNAQFKFIYNDSIEVKKNGTPLKLPWAGGLNNAQFSDIDFDFDGDLDLFVLDRSSDQILLFQNVIINNQRSYQFIYNAERLFPTDVRYRATMIDYNNDGKKDLFSYGIGGIKVYKNVGNTSNGLQWEVAKNLIYSNYFGNNYNLYVSSSDIPAITDVDHDGDLDILTFEMGGEHLQYHKNMSMELYGNSDSLVYVLKNQCWGKFSEDINSSAVTLNDSSPICTNGNIPNAELGLNNTSNSIIKPEEYQPKHAGSSVLALDIDNSSTMDLILGDVSFPNLNLLINGGSAPNSNSAMISNDVNFPSNSIPVNIQVFPASFYLDVDFDGKKDLVAAPNSKSTFQNENGILFYKNTGSTNLPVFTFQENGFLQNQMIEHGTGAIPVFTDIDNDGLEDLFVSNFYRYKPTLARESTIAYYKNTGTASAPKFTYITDDFLSLSSVNYGQRLVPTFGDLDNDGDKDLMIGLENGTLVYYQNSGTSSVFQFSTPVQNYADHLGNTINTIQFAAPQLIDLTKDGLLDLMIGRKNGTITFYENIGTNTTPLFELKNSQLGSVNVSIGNQDCFAIPHFFEYKDTLHLFVGNSLGEFYHFNNIENNLNPQDSFNRVTNDYFPITKNAFSSYWANDLDNDGELNVFVGQDLGGLFHFENDSNSILGINELINIPDFAVFPNPFSNKLSIESSISIIQSIEIIDILGNTLVTLKPNNSNTSIDTTQLSQGVYLLKIQSNNKQFVVKRILKN